MVVAMVVAMVVLDVCVCYTTFTVFEDFDANTFYLCFFQNDFNFTNTLTLYLTKEKKTTELQGDGRMEDLGVGGNKVGKGCRNKGVVTAI